MKIIRAGALMVCLHCALETAAQASFHLMQIEQVIAGVGGDTTAQAIQLRLRSDFQNQVQQARMRAWDANGANPVVVVDFASGVPGLFTGDRILVTTANFVDLTVPEAFPDFTMAAIPASYLAAGSLTFESDAGTIWWRLSWGGAGYTGSTTGQVSNDSDGNFGPPYPGPLPTATEIALQFQGSATAKSTSNDVDYALTSEAAVFINNFGASFLVSVPGAKGACCDDMTGICNDTDFTQTDCENIGNRYGGNFSTCGTINPPCSPPPTGACCYDGYGICEAGVNTFQCTANGGRFGGPGTTCGTINPACDPPGLAVNLQIVAPTEFGPTAPDPLTAPVDLTHAGDGSGRLFVVDQIGQIRVIKDGALLDTPFLDVSGIMVTLNPGFDERGLLGLAFHPNYASNGRFFIRYSKPRTGSPGEPCFSDSRGCHESILAEYSVLGSPATSDVADPNSEVILFQVDQPQFNHNAGHVAFGPDGLLYFALGDGGGAHDGLADSPPSHGTNGNGQNVNTALGSILRIDVDSAPDPGLAYHIPPTNPFAGAAGLDEIYAYGFRNPYRFSFDDGPGGAGSLYVGDVGQNLFEEIDVVVNGGNYGWATREGFVCFDPFNPNNPPGSCSNIGLMGEPLLDPVMVYDHNEGLAVIGGYVYRGSSYPALSGKYVFGDFSRDFGPNGRLFYTDTTGPNAFELNEFFLQPGPGTLGKALFGLGEDEDGELYVLASDNIGPTGTTGIVYRMTAPVPEVRQTSPRYLQVRPPPGSEPYALLLTAQCPGGPARALDTPAPGGSPANLSMLIGTASPPVLSSSVWGPTLITTGVEITPGTAYTLQSAWGSPGSFVLSPEVPAPTSDWGDVTGEFNLGVWADPDGSVDISTDAVAALDRFKNLATAPEAFRVDLVHFSGFPQCLPDLSIDIVEVTSIIDAFKVISYETSTGCGPACP